MATSAGVISAEQNGIEIGQQFFPINIEGLHNAARVSAGVWDFQAADTPTDVPPSAGWGELRVPSSWIVNATDNFTISPADAASPHAWYRRSFSVPAAWADGRRVKLLFLAVDWAHKIFANGTLVHE